MKVLYINIQPQVSLKLIFHSVFQLFSTKTNFNKYIQLSKLPVVQISRKQPRLEERRYGPNRLTTVPHILPICLPENDSKYTETLNSITREASALKNNWNYNTLIQN